MKKEGTGTTYKIQAGDAYVFDNHESHYIRGGPDGAKIICIFTPACTGKEVSITIFLLQNSILLTLMAFPNPNSGAEHGKIVRLIE